MKKRFSMRALILLFLPLVVSCAPVTSSQSSSSSASMSSSSVEPTLLDRVDATIDAFVEHYGTYYLQPGTYDYQVVAAMKDLDVLSEYSADTAALSTHILASDTSSLTLGQWYKSIVTLQSLDVDVSTFVDAHLDTLLAGSTSIGQYSSPTTLWITTLLNNETYASYQQAALNDLTQTNTPRLNDMDWGASIALSLFPHREEPAVSTVLEEYFTWLPTVQEEDGAFIESYAWSVANAAIIANVLLTLVAYDMDPCAAPFTTGNQSMVEKLLSYSNSDGSFQYAFGDEDPDLAFTTPLAFTALVAYQQFALHGTDQ